MVALGALALAVVMTAGACRPGWSDGRSGHGDPSSRDQDGFVPASWMRQRQDDYLRFATAQLSPGSVTNVINHAERARRDPSFHFDAAAVTPATLAASFDKIDNFVDTAGLRPALPDEPVVRKRDQLTPEVRSAIDQRIVAFKYWYTDPQPAGRRRPAVLLDREPRDALPRRGVPGRPGVPADHVRQRREAGRRAPSACRVPHRHVAHREGALRVHRMALGRLLPEDRRRAAHVHRVRRRPGPGRARVDGPRPPALRPRAAPAAGQQRRDARPVVHEGQERRRGPGRLRDGEAPLRRHRASVQVGRRRRRNALRPRPSLPAPGRAPAGRPEHRDDRRPRAHGGADRPARARHPEPAGAVRVHVRRPGQHPVLVGARRAHRLAGGADDDRGAGQSTTCGSRTSSSRSSPSPTSPAATRPSRAPSPRRSRHRSRSGCSAR